jgi:phosphatidylinositol alpha-mannosyltransferase
MTTPLKVGLVTPYIYPQPGGVNAHVRYLYENLIARGHDVRIISSIHGPQKHSEGDVIRLGYGFSVPANGSVGTLTFSPRYANQVREVLDRERFDVLHFHEPFVPFLSLLAECGGSCWSAAAARTRQAPRNCARS